MIKTLQKPGIEKIYLNKIKAIYNKPTDKEQTSMSTLATSIQHSFGSLSYSNQRINRSKANLYMKRRI